MLWTFDDLIHDKPVGEMDMFMCAEPVGREEFVVRAAIDREGAPVVIEADDILFVDLVLVADLIQFPLILSSLDCLYCAAGASSLWNSSR